MAKPVKNKKKLKGIFGNMSWARKQKTKKQKDTLHHFLVLWQETTLTLGQMKGDLVLDPMNGSGNKPVFSALQLGREYIGIDMSKRILRISKEKEIEEYEKDNQDYSLKKATAYNSVYKKIAGFSAKSKVSAFNKK